MSGRAAAALVAVVIGAGTAAAEVIDRSAAGFTSRTTREVAAPAAVVWEALTGHIGEWWEGSHTYSGDSANLSLAPRPGGCFCEALPDGGGVEHAVVVQVQAGALLRLRGALGPLQESGVAGSLTWHVEDAPGGSRLTTTYIVGGYYPGGLDAIADAVDAVIAAQVAGLKAFAEARAAK